MNNKIYFSVVISVYNDAQCYLNLYFVMDENKRGNKYRATFPLRQNEMSIERSLFLSSGYDDAYV